MAPSNPSKAVRDKLATHRTITLTVTASESNLQRLAGFMMFADRPPPEPAIEPGGPDDLMPWEDPNDPRFVPDKPPPPPLDIDYEVVRRSITKHLAKYVEKHGADNARKVLTSFGAPRLSEVPQDQLLALDAALDAALQAEPKRTKKHGRSSNCFT